MRQMPQLKFTPEVRHFSGESKPVPALIPVPHVPEKLPVMEDRICRELSSPVPEVHVVRMGIEKRHTAMFDDPVEFSFPDLTGALLQDNKKAEILGERVGELDIAVIRNSWRLEVGGWRL